MKFCLNCGSEIEDNIEYCPYCHIKVHKINKTPFSSKAKISNNYSDKKDTLVYQLILNYVLGVLLEITGVIVLVIYCIKEFQFHLDYNLSNLSDEGINFLRVWTGNDLNIDSIIVAIVLMVFGSIILSIPKIVKYVKQKNKKEI